MFKRKKKDQTPGAQATRAQSNIFVRIVGCGFLVYIMRELIISEEFNTGEFWKIGLVVLLGLAGLFIAVLTIIELVRNVKRGVYSPKYYETAEQQEELKEVVELEEVNEIVELGEVAELEEVNETIELEEDKDSKTY